MALGVLLALSLLSFLVTLAALPSWIHRARDRGFVGKDVHKGNVEVAEMGGLAVLLGTTLALSAYIAIETLLMGNNPNSMLFMLAALASFLIAAMIGMADDMLGSQLGLRQREKVFLTLLVPIPMMVVNAGHSAMRFPFLGDVELGLLYPLLFLPGGIIGATNGFNMLAGYNGLEAGMGMIILGALGYLSLTVGATNAAVLAFCLAAALLALMLFNRYPSRVFPGDTTTYPVGASIALVAVLADLERYALMLFLPYYIELALKARGKLKPEWSAKILEDGSLAVKERCYSVPHLAIKALRKIKGRAYEYEVVALVLAFELAVALFTVYSLGLSLY